MPEQAAGVVLPLSLWPKIRILGKLPTYSRFLFQFRQEPDSTVSFPPFPQFSPNATFKKYFCYTENLKLRGLQSFLKESYDA